MDGGNLRVFWHTYRHSDRSWRIVFKTMSPQGDWSAAVPFSAPGSGSPPPHRRSPFAVADHEGGMWLFWLERPDKTVPWVLKYLKKEGPDWTGQSGQTFPDFGDTPPRVEDDVFVLAHPSAALRRLWT